MSARILVVDDIETNRRLLEARLSAEYFEVVEAEDGEAALKAARDHAPDLILLDIMMPGMDGFETCRRLKADPTLRHIPVVMVTALDQRNDRIKGLEAGADEFLTKPVDDVALFARVRSLLRLKVVMDELRLRESSDEVENEQVAIGGRIVVAGPDGEASERVANMFRTPFSARACSEPLEALRHARTADLIVIDLTHARFDGLRLAARIRSDAATRQTPILGIVESDDRAAMVRALDLGVTDVILRPVDPGELEARARTQVRRKAYADALRDRLEESLEMAVTDALTGLHNRRYVVSRLRQHLDALERSGEGFAVALIDIDHFKRINDSWGHQAGDLVLKGFAERLRKELRAIDIAGRYGGEEFLIVFSGSTASDALEACERFRAAMAREPFVVSGTGDPISVTVSAGVTVGEHGDDVEDIVARADAALYEAKSSGRNQVIAWRRRAA
jgi:two-component system cell cycle response regulator